MKNSILFCVATFLYTTHMIIPKNYNKIYSLNSSSKKIKKNKRYGPIRVSFICSQNRQLAEDNQKLKAEIIILKGLLEKKHKVE